ncbi:hypothetical protein ADN00_11760 [Ornatilinea apprima]|uniref:Phosphoenolpyruvate synthase n=1 Tax=Ornatilinea apprima TaxID=1134406 RepID=A0A0P6X8Z9_9CHLR|nr:PEP/pyruvate-binding domain-containing protein [Ornatilinea apprima]KPL76030.1 hypothetical protein ADN00_11760 [Ornatilinea apprima]
MSQKMRLITPIISARLDTKAGNKAKNLHALQKAGYQIPKTWVCNWSAFERYQANDISVIEELKTELEGICEPGKRYAVRSSANVEDDINQSFAGQFKTVLDVDSADQILQAMWAIWATANSQPVQTYIQTQFFQRKGLLMAVIIQEMVPPFVSGVSFSKNPMTGMDEVVVEAVRGRGDQLVQEGTTPYRWVWKWGCWLKQPVVDEISQTLIDKVVSGTREIAKTFDQDVDLEWVSDGQTLYWLQMRQITTISGVTVYSNKLAKEMLPGLVKPLIWSINIPLVNGAWVRVMTELVGKNDLTPEKMAKAFHYRTYFNMSILGDIFKRLGMPPESLEMMMGVAPEGFQSPKMKPNLKMMRLLPRLMVFMLDKLTFERRILKELPVLEEEFARHYREKWGEWSDGEIMKGIDALFDTAQKMAYFNIVGPLLMMLYNGSLKSELKKVNVDFDHLQVVDGERDLGQFDPAPWMKALNQRFRNMADQDREAILHLSFDEFMAMDKMDGFREDVLKFIQHFGHLSDSGNDFSQIPWREDPDTLFKLILHYEPEPGLLEKKISFENIPLKGVHRWVLRHIYRRARDFRLFRERISFRYTFGYGLFRIYFMELARRFVSRGWLQAVNDIFYIYLPEIRAVVAGETSANDLAGLVEQRKREMENAQQVVLPQIIFGEEIPPVDQEGKCVLNGVGTSGGYFEGTAKVVRGLRDFSKIEQSEILVIPYSDVSWTPLFAKAGAVVSESGGMLSHSSIIAREYHIPCVVSVPDVTLLPDGTRLLVNGYSGEVMIVNGAEKSAVEGIE